MAGSLSVPIADRLGMNYARVPRALLTRRKATFAARHGLSTDSLSEFPLSLASRAPCQIASFLTLAGCRNNVSATLTRPNMEGLSGRGAKNVARLERLEVLDIQVGLCKSGVVCSSATPPQSSAFSSVFSPHQFVTALFDVHWWK